MMSARLREPLAEGPKEEESKELPWKVSKASGLKRLKVSRSLGLISWRILDGDDLAGGELTSTSTSAESSSCQTSSFSGSSSSSTDWLRGSSMLKSKTDWA